jgi:hypothetical protein
MLRHWLASAVLATMAGLYIVAGLSVAWLEPASATPNARISANGTAGHSRDGHSAQPEPLQFREIAPQDAVAINAAVPVSTLPNPAARPFGIAFATPADRLRALECLTAAVYYEAAVEPTDGPARRRPGGPQPGPPPRLSAQRLRSRLPGVGAGDRLPVHLHLRRRAAPHALGLGWARARRVAEEALAGKVYAPVGWATHYHTNWVVPYWSSSLLKVANVGTHIFYRWEGGWGKPAAFRLGPAPGRAANGRRCAA